MSLFWAMYELLRSFVKLIVYCNTLSWRNIDFVRRPQHLHLPSQQGSIGGKVVLLDLPVPMVSF